MGAAAAHGRKPRNEGEGDDETEEKRGRERREKERGRFFDLTDREARELQCTEGYRLWYKRGRDSVCLQGSVR